MTKYREHKDDTLVQLALLGEDKAFEELVTRHERAVKGTAYKVTGNAYSAEDASQDAFVSAWMNLSALREPAKFGPWVCGIAKNHARQLVAHYRSMVRISRLTTLKTSRWTTGEVRWRARRTPRSYTRRWKHSPRRFGRRSRFITLKDFRCVRSPGDSTQPRGL